MRSTIEFAPLAATSVSVKRRGRRPFFPWLAVMLAVVVLWFPGNAQAQCGACGCPAGQDCYCGTSGSCYCVPGTPIIIDLSGDGFTLTSPAEGVQFDFFLNGPVQISWTASGADEGWLVLDRNGDGRIDNGAEMFGNLTPQPPSDDPNGFLALAVYDEPRNGGNGDGIIDSRDAIFSRLRIWRDSNHNGISDPGELISLQEAGIQSISLSYTESGRVDKWGNRFRYRARVVSTGGADKWAYDVILQFTNTKTTSDEKWNAIGDDGDRTARTQSFNSSGQQLIVATQTVYTLRPRAGLAEEYFDQSAATLKSGYDRAMNDLALPEVGLRWDGG